MDTEYYEYESDHADRFHDYEEDAMQDSHWPADSANDVEDEEHYDDDDRYDDEFSDDDNPYNEDLGWDGGYED